MDILHLDMTYQKDNAREKNNRYIKMLSYLTLQKNIILFSSNATYMYNVQSSYESQKIAF